MEELDGDMKTWEPPKVKTGYRVHCFPDNCILICPDAVPVGQDRSLEITALWYNTIEKAALRQLIISYDAQGLIASISNTVFQ